MTVLKEKIEQSGATDFQDSDHPAVVFHVVLEHQKIKIHNSEQFV